MTFACRAIATLFTVALAIVAFTPAQAVNAPVYREFTQGNSKAKVTVIEYASLTCHFCAAFNETGYPKLKAEYIDTGKINFIYRDFPTDGLSTAAALLTRCAPADRGKVLVDMLFKNQAAWTQVEKPIEPLRSYAQLAGMSNEDVDACLKNDALLHDIQDVQQKAQMLYKVRATPTFFVGEEQVQGNDFDAIKRAIDKQLK